MAFTMYKLSPSKAHRYLQCTKSLEYDTEFVETEATRRGTFLHMVAEHEILNKEIDRSDMDSYENFLIDSYVRAVYDERDLIGAKKVHVENKIGITVFGHHINMIVDAFMKSKTTASIVDLKTGNYDVSAEKNEQLAFYALAILLNNPDIKNIRVSIFQKGKMKTVEMSRKEIFDFFIEHEKTFNDIRENNLTFNPSEKACRYCAHRNECRAYAEWVLKNG
jgi:hypothetical protein